MENVGQIMLEVFMHFCQLIRIGLQYPVSHITFTMYYMEINSYLQTPFALFFIIIGTYFTLYYLEVSLAASVDLLVGLCWPVIHICLRGVERLFYSAGDWFGSVDDIGGAMYCDMAASWCQKFKLMCDAQCSFTDFTLERLRKK